MPSSQRFVVELSSYYLQAAVVSGGRLVAHREFKADDTAGLAAFAAEHAAGLPVDVALVSPASRFAALLGADETPALRNASAVLARGAQIAGSDAHFAACDATDGRTPRADGAPVWLLTGTSNELVSAATDRLSAAHLAPAASAPALPAQLGAVIELIRDTPGATRIAVWEPGESSSRLWLVSAEGIESVKDAPAGFPEIFEAVQGELGLKFRAAATKLFFNDQYDFGELGGKIGARLANSLRDAVGKTPTAFHVIGLPAGQAWLGQAIAAALGTSPWSPAESAAFSRYGVSADALSPRLVGLLQAAAVGVKGPWAPAWITSDTVIPASAPAAVAPAPTPPPPAPAPAPAPAPIKPPAPVAKPTPPTPTPAPAPAPAKPVAKPAVVPPAPAKPAPAAAKPVAKPAAPAAKPATPVAAPAAATAPRPAAPAKKSPYIPVIGGLVALAVLGGGAAFFLRPKSAPKPAPATATVAPKSSSASGASAGPTLSPAELAALQAEVKRDPLGFKNANYQFTVSNKGVLTHFTVAGRPAPWIRNLGFMRLYGVSTLPDGRRSARRAGDMSSPDYQAKIVKRVHQGAVVFDVDITHPKYTFSQTFICLPNSLKVQVRFMPQILADERGPLDAVYGVHFDTADFADATGKPLIKSNELVYATKHGPLSLRYDAAFKGSGSQPIVGDPALASFVLAAAGAKAARELDYEIVLP